MLKATTTTRAIAAIKAASFALGISPLRALGSAMSLGAALCRVNLPRHNAAPRTQLSKILQTVTDRVSREGRGGDWYIGASLEPRGSGRSYGLKPVHRACTFHQ